MPLTHHDDQELVAGDDWTIDGVLLDVNGSSLDLTNASFQWTLIDPTGTSVADLVGGTTINVIQPATSGQVQICVPAAMTAPLLAGRFHDALRVTLNFSSTYWMGTILVDGNPFDLIPPFVPNVSMNLSPSNITASSAGLGTPSLIHN
jgi:hypothetical protein